MSGERQPLLGAQPERSQAQSGSQSRSPQSSQHHSSAENYSQLIPDVRVLTPASSNRNHSDVPGPSYQSFNADSTTVNEGTSHCHDGQVQESDEIRKNNLKARRQLIIASVFCLVFMTAETIGGALANSLAIMTDAAHLLTDFASFMISLLALYIAARPATTRMSFGWHRAEVVGAIVSVLLIWVVTGILVYLAIMRIVEDKYEIDGLIMLITSAVGIGVNLIMGFVLHQHGHDHGHDHGGHGHSHGHDHSHSHTKYKKVGGGESEMRAPLAGDAGQSAAHGDHDHDHDHSHEHKHEHKHDHGPGGHHSHDGHSHDEDVERGPNSMISAARDLFGGAGDGGNRKDVNINVRAAFIHVLGDLLQSVGVFIAALIIFIKPEYKIADPICTFIFSILVLITTINILRDALNVIMEATPRGLDFNDVRDTLLAVPGVRAVHNLRLWSLTMNKTAMSAHLAVAKDFDQQAVLKRAMNDVKEKFGVVEVTIQIEEHSVMMDRCAHCSPPVQ